MLSTFILRHCISYVGEVAMMDTPKELIDKILDGEWFDQDDKAFAESVSSHLGSIGITKKQWMALRRIVEETEAALNGCTPYGEEHSYRL